MDSAEPGDPSPRGRRGLPEIHSVLRATATAAAGGTLVIWWPAFTLGAYNDIFFDDVLALWAVATAVLLSGLVLHRRIAVPRSSVIALLLPSIWIVLGMAAPRSKGFHYLHYLEVVITILSAPYLTWLLSKILLPDYHELPSAQRFGAVGITAVMGILAFLLGQFNYLFLTCADFDVSGNNTPPGCAQGPPFRLR
ncbi:hypothetical protein [Streptomyces palmae]|uniref:Uncharacterized protein n=1 Tax=Streptomyces palmae TaxID=1701085 RepID=A0A4Z0H634_9ACTN|nr:hypothetical protein [Streptomyces palmae]TGB07863.1 hypothetical protein E4099_16520 [Streptomyces palmae]